MPRPRSALWLVHKPVGATSASLVEAFRRDHGGDRPLKVSHGGVLDPFAEGLVVLLVGAANRLFERLHEVPKRYRAVVEWGVETDTGDAGGAPLPGAGAAPPAAERLEAALLGFLGWTLQVPPATSNKRVDGERAYVRAHRGETFELPPARVYCHAARWLAHDLPRRSTLELDVRGGFYVRSLARDLGRALGTGAHLSALQRVAIGPYRTPGDGAPVEVTGESVLPWLPTLRLTDDEWGRLRRGAPLPQRSPDAPAWPLPVGFPPPLGVRVMHQRRLVAVTGAERTIELPGGV